MGVIAKEQQRVYTKVNISLVFPQNKHYLVEPWVLEPATLKIQNQCLQVDNRKESVKCCTHTWTQKNVKENC
jgi:hypothetical protein